ELEAEFGVPQWVFGLTTYAFESAERIVCAFTEKGLWQLGTINTRTKQFERIDTPFTDIDYVQAAPGRAVFRAASSTQPFAIVEMNWQPRQTTIRQCAANVEIDDGYISAAQPIEFPTENGLTAHGFYYAPRNRDFTAATDERPLLLVKSHGGPTA